MDDFTHGGHLRDLAARAGCDPGELLDFSANINPLGAPGWLRAEVGAALSGTVHYPDPQCLALVQAASERFGCPRDEVLAGNGSTEILYALCRALDIDQALVPVPSYTDYRRACELVGVPVQPLVLDADNDFALDFDSIESSLRACGSSRCAVFLGQPNNPTGQVFDPQSLRQLAARHPGAWFVVDEAFADFVPGLERLIANRPANVVVLHSLTKFYAIAGLRLGLGYAAPEVASAIRRLIPPWSVNGLALAVGARALRDEEYARRTLDVVPELRRFLVQGLEALPNVAVFPGQANFVLCRLGGQGPRVEELCAALLGQGIAVRDCASFEGLGQGYFRVAVRSKEESRQLLNALTAVLNVQNSKIIHMGKTSAIMVQGCTSNAGKSVLAAALCRILLQEGFRVAPFKSQNMSLNSYVTQDGGEMGRAQVTQAMACRLDPDVRMNPVLLKPCSDTGSQVIVMGQPVGNMRVAEYVKYKDRAFEEAKAAYDSLTSEHDVIVLEGAGSPAEINLKRHDIVNMAMARHAQSKVLLAGDIDRGGVFAAFVGTMELLEQWERDLVVGLVVNRFRGDESLLGEALDYTRARTGVPVVGVVPYLPDLGLPEEDSVSFKSGALDMAPSAERVVEIAVIDLPHLSNFTDLDALAGEPDVYLRVVRRAEDLGTPQALILPGTKNVVADMAALHDSDMVRAIKALAGQGTTQVIGVCGGFQMLGREILDPHGLESGGSVPGLGLLPVSTELAPHKTLVRVGATHVPSGLSLSGYEIHHGRTRADSGAELPVQVLREDGEAIGLGLPGEMVWGTYLHGLFDADEFRRWFVDRLRQGLGLDAIGRVVQPYGLEAALDRLADVVRSRIGIKQILRMTGLK